MALNATIVWLERSAILAAAPREHGLELCNESPTHLSPAQCVLIAESVEAIESARSAGLVCLAVGRDAESFRAAGARMVYPDAGQLIANLDDALTIASPGSAHLT